MTRWPDGKERVCSGTTVRYGEHRGDTDVVFETPREVRELMKSSPDDLLELHARGNREVPVYIDRREIIALSPYWAVVE